MKLNIDATESKRQSPAVTPSMKMRTKREKSVVDVAFDNLSIQHAEMLDAMKNGIVEPRTPRKPKSVNFTASVPSGATREIAAPKLASLRSAAS